MTTPHRYRIIPPEALREKGIMFSRTQLYRKSKEGSFPKPVQVGKQRIGYVEAEIDAWIESLIADRDATREVA